MKSTSTKLSHLAASLAGDAVRIQRIFDKKAEMAEADFLRLATGAPESARPLLMPLAPVRQVVAEHRVSCSIRVGMSLDVSGELRVAPLHLGLAAAYRERRQEASRLEVVVVAAPRQPGAPPPDPPSGAGPT